MSAIPLAIYVRQQADEIFTSDTVPALRVDTPGDNCDDQLGEVLRRSDRS